MIRNVMLALAASAALVAVLLLCLGFGPRDVARMFAHPIRGGTGVESAAPPPPPGPEHAEPRRLSGLDYTAIAVYMLAMIPVGMAAGRRVKGTRSFFLANGRMNWVLVAVAVLATYLSALTMMALPAMAFGEHDWTYMVQLPFLAITAAVITRWVLPRFRDAGVASIYAFREQRIGVSARLIAATSFVIVAVGRMGLVLYLPSLAFSTVTGFPLVWRIVVTGAVITVYTVVGGIEAVVWTDAIQAVVLVAGAILSLAFVFRDIGGGEFLRVGLAHNKFRTIVPSLSVFRIATLWLVLETLFQTIRIYGTQQDMAQRYLTTSSTAEANRSVWFSIIAYIPLGFLFYLLGTALFVFYQVHPGSALPARRTRCTRTSSFISSRPASRAWSSPGSWPRPCRASIAA